jgi:hypothetical protein
VIARTLLLAIAHGLLCGAIAHRTLGQGASATRRARFAITIGVLAFVSALVLALSGVTG